MDYLFLKKLKRLKMVTKEERICDICNNRVAHDKCILCKKDLCNSCVRPSFEALIRSKTTTSILGKIIFCSECKKRTVTQLGDDLFDEEFNKELCDEIGKYLIKKMMLENL